MAASSPDATQQHTPPTAGDATAKAAASFSLSHLVLSSLLSLCSLFHLQRFLFPPTLILKPQTTSTQSRQEYKSKQDLCVLYKNNVAE